MDEGGVATVGELHAGLVQVYLSDTPERCSGWVVGTVDLTAKDGEIETVVEPQVPVVLRLWIDGVAALPDEAVAYMGDDVNDVPLLRKVGLSACPADAHPSVPGEVHFVTRSPGGRGAVRELCDLILRAKAQSR